MKDYPLSVDWLSLTLSLRSPVGSAPADHSWCRYDGTNVWASRWCLFNEYGEKVFTLLFQPKSRLLSPDSALFEVANEWLYHGVGINGCLRLLEHVCSFTIKGVSRVDLAVDFTPSDEQASIIRRLATGECYVAGKRNRVPWYQTISDDFYPMRWQGEVPYNQSWGHKTSDVRWKIYFKTKELRDEAKGKGWSKPYIVDMWREVGLDERDAWRCEVSIHNANGFTCFGQPLSFHELMHGNISNIFSAIYSSRFIIRVNQGHKDKTNDEEVELIPVSRVKRAFKVRRDEVVAEHNSSLTLLRHLIADVQTEQVMVNEVVREGVLELIGTLLERDGLRRYFREVVGDEYESWVEEVRVRAYYFGDNEPKMYVSEVPVIERVMIESGIVNEPLVDESSYVSPAERDRPDIYAQRFERLKRMEVSASRMRDLGRDV